MDCCADASVNHFLNLFCHPIYSLRHRQSYCSSLSARCMRQKQYSIAHPRQGDSDAWQKIYQSSVAPVVLCFPRIEDCLSIFALICRWLQIHQLALNLDLRCCPLHYFVLPKEVSTRANVQHRLESDYRNCHSSHFSSFAVSHWSRGRPLFHWVTDDDGRGSECTLVKWANCLNCCLKIKLL